MRAFSKQVSNRLVRFLHQVIYNEKGRFLSKVVQVWKSLVKYYSRILTEQLLVLCVTVDYPTRWWIYHS